MILSRVFTFEIFQTVVHLLGDLLKFSVSFYQGKSLGQVHTKETHDH